MFVPQPARAMMEQQHDASIMAALRRGVQGGVACIGAGVRGVGLWVMVITRVREGDIMAASSHRLIFRRGLEYRSYGVETRVLGWVVKVAIGRDQGRSPTSGCWLG